MAKMKYPTINKRFLELGFEKYLPYSGATPRYIKTLKVRDSTLGKPGDSMHSWNTIKMVVIIRNIYREGFQVDGVELSQINHSAGDKIPYSERLSEITGQWNGLSGAELDWLLDNLSDIKALIKETR